VVMNQWAEDDGAMNEWRIMADDGAMNDGRWWCDKWMGGWWRDEWIGVCSFSCASHTHEWMRSL
jgi:hypothetical protein